MKDRLEFDNFVGMSAEELLESYAGKPARRFLVVDVHRLDEEGVNVECYRETELRNTDTPAHLYIPEGTTKGEALFYLSRAIKVLKKDWHRITEHPGLYRLYHLDDTSPDD